MAIVIVFVFDVLIPSTVSGLLVPTQPPACWRRSRQQSTKTYRHTRRLQGLFTTSNSESILDTFTCHIPPTLSPKESVQVVDGILIPSKDYGMRLKLGRDAQGLKLSALVSANDPVMAFTYGEFPLTSMDQLIDLALSNYLDTASVSGSSAQQRKRICMVDVGSGCGRLCFHAALTRRGVPGKSSEDDNGGTAWDIVGIEIADELHLEALRGVLTGIEEGYFSEGATSIDSNDNTLVLHHGPADRFASVFGQADLIFAYSTVWNTNGFSEQLGAMVMAEEWSEMLSRVCKPGCVVVTTDRALDPKYNWQLLDRLDVDNPEVAGSTGYIQVLQTN